MACIRWTLDRETERIEALIAETPELATLVASNGWTARFIAWGHIIAGLIELADFDDERGRVG
jgi:hypothetical protein